MNNYRLLNKLDTVINALGELVNGWDNDTQELFERFAVSPNAVWNIPSLDESLGEFQDFKNFVLSSIYGRWHETHDNDGNVNGYQVVGECPECHSELVEWHDMPKQNHILVCKSCA